MKRAILLILAVFNILSSVHAEDTSDKALAPTGLTLVATDSSGKILDCIAVENAKKSGTIKFSVPEKSLEIRVFALGTRIHKSIPTNRYYTGLPDDKKYYGLGFVRVNIEKGELTGIDSNGFGSLEITESMKVTIKKNLTESKKTDITKIELVKE